MVVVKNIEIVGESEKGWEDAVKNAIVATHKTVRNVFRVKVLSLTADIKNGEIVKYKARVKISFVVER